MSIPQETPEEDLEETLAKAWEKIIDTRDLPPSIRANALIPRYKKPRRPPTVKP